MAKGTLYLKNENNEFRWIENESTDKYDGKYVGQIKNGEPHGYGVFTYQNGERYQEPLLVTLSKKLTVLLEKTFTLMSPKKESR